MKLIPPADEPRRSRTSDAGSGHVTVILLHNVRRSFHLVEYHLRGAGYDVVDATTREAAECAIRRANPAIILTDGDRPEAVALTRSRSTCRRAGGHRAYVITLTDDECGLRSGDSPACGADDRLVMPCRRHELLARVRNGVRIAALERALAYRLATPA